eukprot:CAMPEP_0115014384 /NCGR_PEP_ID=MMETSP0216-20121206/26042_1 /TAXON_ID=223996 /ORGANISM="Protocruzia adherens, Strain Boccale" /LENGTH=75 /DNA_ID=CAMNT_0002384105 /DNA_START=13 /DNA_END=237 /DNA_ORIENTATION=-
MTRGEATSFKKKRDDMQRKITKNTEEVRKNKEKVASLREENRQMVHEYWELLVKNQPLGIDRFYTEYWVFRGQKN